MAHEGAADEKVQVSKWYHIRTSFIPAKLAYFLLGVTEGIFTPYVNLFLINAGLPPSLAGTVSGVSMLVWFMGALMWGFIADYSRRYRLHLLIAVIGGITFAAPLPWIPGILNSTTQNADTNNTFYANISDALERNASSSALNATESTNYLFYIMLALIPLMLFFDVCFQILTDSMVMKQVAASNEKMDYGRTRLFMPLGFSLGSLVISAMFKIDIDGLNFAKYSIQYFTLYPAVATLVLVNAHFLLKHVEIPTKSDKTDKKDEGVLKCLLKTIFQGHVLFFLATVFMLGIFDGLHINFVLVYMEENNAEEIYLGVTAALGMISGIGVYMIVSKLIKLIGGPIAMLAVSCICCSIRFLVYGYTKSALAFVAIQLQGGLCISAFLAAAMMHTETVSPKAVRSSMYGIVNGIIFGGGYTTSHVAGGILYQKYGGQMLYRGAALASLAWGIIVIVGCFYNRTKVERKDDKEDDRSFSESDDENTKLNIEC